MDTQSSCVCVCEGPFQNIFKTQNRVHPHHPGAGRRAQGVHADGRRKRCDEGVPEGARDCRSFDILEEQDDLLGDINGKFEALSKGISAPRPVLSAPPAAQTTGAVSKRATGMGRVRTL
jgi:hypothetical protein